MDGNRSVGEVTGAILAGGRATRFLGINKATLDVGGHRIVDRQLAILRATTVEQLIIGQIGAAFDGLPATVVPDAVAHAGPMGGLLTALSVARSPRVIILACDLPFVTEDFVRYIVKLAPEVDAVVPRTVEGWQPLCAVYAARLAPFVAARVESGRLAMHELLREVAVRTVEPAEIAPFDPDGRLFLNLNSPADYDAIRRP